MSKIVTDQNLSEILQQHEIVVLDFWAGWCAPCKSFAPIFERVASKFPDIFFGKVNTEVERQISQDLGIRSIPTLVILKDQTIIFQESGSIPEYALTNIVSKAKTIDVSTLEQDDDDQE